MRIQIYPWLTSLLGAGNTAPFFLDEEIADGDSLRSILLRLATKYPDLGRVILDAEGQKLTGKVCAFVNRRHAELLDGLETRIKEADTVTLVPPIGGG
ncbi:MAG: MoaD/ThiS family protein [Chloroflexi bacterium]|nr:MoaD/ThiS family protein [Chloroflexota bacterium]